MFTVSEAMKINKKVYCLFMSLVSFIRRNVVLLDTKRKGGNSKNKLSHYVRGRGGVGGGGGLFP